MTMGASLLLVAAGFVLALCCVALAGCAWLARQIRLQAAQVEAQGAQHLDTLRAAAASIQELHNTAAQEHAKLQDRVAVLEAAAAGTALVRPRNR